MKLSVKMKVLMLKLVIHLTASMPVAWLYYSAFIDELGADPVKAVIHFTGIGAFNLLLLTLLVSPLAKALKQGFLLSVRRLLGLYAFTYGLLHLFNFIAFDIQFEFALLISEIIKRPYITIGMVALILLIALAVTSINGIKRKMGKSWQKLHNMNYLLVLLVGIHFYWSVKSEIIEPSIYLLITGLLLYLRRDKISRWLKLAFYRH
jgi:sulfoxide reductase heme-binding subunit YedZ